MIAAALWPTSENEGVIGPETSSPIADAARVFIVPDECRIGNYFAAAGISQSTTITDIGITPFAW